MSGLDIEGLELLGWLPDADEARRHVARLAGSAEAACIFQTFDDSEEQKRPHLTRVLYGTIAKCFDELRSLNLQGAGIFVTVNMMQGRKRGNDYLAHFRAVWQEDDTQGAASQLPLRPQLVVQSSERKFHRYILTRTDDVEQWRGVQERLVSDYQSDGNAKDPARVLRLAGFLHLKDPSNPQPVRIVEANDTPPYPWDEVVAKLPPALAEPSVGSGVSLLPDRVDGNVVEGGRNDFLFREASSLQRRGNDPRAIEAALLALNEASCDPPLPASEVRAIARSVRRYDPEESLQAVRALELRSTKNGVIADEENVLRIISRHPDLIGIVRFDEFRGEMILARPISDDLSLVSDRDTPRPWRDSDTVILQTFIQRYILPRIGRDKIDSVVAMYARQHGAFHPLREYLQSLTWDCVPRLDTWLRDYMGARKQPAEYLAAVGARWLISAVAPILSPGCQADSALVLEGPQGILKSTALRTLASDEYFSDSLPADLHQKDARDHLRGKWILEMSELAQFRRGDVEMLKQYITRRYEQYRPSYGRHEITFPRQCVFAGTTNADEYLSDQTGNRRFWGVLCELIDIEALRRDRDQLWGEAVTRYRAGEPWHLTGQIVAIAADEAQARVAHDPWTVTVLQALDNEMPPPTTIAPGEVLELMGLPTTERHGRNAARVAQILRDLGWRKGKRDRTRGQLYESVKL